MPGILGGCCKSCGQPWGWDRDRIRIFQETSRGLGDSTDVKNERKKSKK